MPVANYTTAAVHIRTGGTRVLASQPPEWSSFGVGGANLPGHPAAADVLDNWCMQVLLNQALANGDTDQRMYFTDASITVITWAGFADMNFSGSLTVEVLMDPLPLPMRTADGTIVQGTEFDPRNYTLPWQRRVIHRRYFTSADWPIVDGTTYTLILDSDAISTLNSIITDPRWPATTTT